MCTKFYRPREGYSSPWICVVCVCVIIPSALGAGLHVDASVCGWSYTKEEIRSNTVQGFLKRILTLQVRSPFHSSAAGIVLAPCVPRAGVASFFASPVSLEKRVTWHLRRVIRLCVPAFVPDLSTYVCPEDKFSMRCCSSPPPYDDTARLPR